MTDGNLNRHLQVLQEAGLILMRKASEGNRPQTICQLTALGQRRFVEYIGVLEQVVEDALQAASLATAAAQTAPRRLVNYVTPDRLGARSLGGQAFFRFTHFAQQSELPCKNSTSR